MTASDDTDRLAGLNVEAAFRLNDEVDDALAQLKAKLPALDAARRLWRRTRSDADRIAVDQVQAEADALNKRYGAAVLELQRVLGITEEELAEIDAERSGVGLDQLPRRALTADDIEPTADLDGDLPLALEAIEAMLPKGWIDEEQANKARLDALFGPDGVLSITKGLRPASEAPSIHRLRQGICLARDYVAGNLAYDHFAGATQIPTLVQFGRELEHLRIVGGDRDERLRKLWMGPSAMVDSTFFELLIAARCVGRGRNVRFIPETSDTSPDLECSDPFPIVIECKRQEPLSRYEQDEEILMRQLFVLLRQQARARGLAGIFEVQLTVEARELDLADVGATLVRQRLAARPEQPLTYAWGTVAYRELPRRLRLPDVTRAYSPTMLKQVFGWNMDLPEWDGLCCSIANARGGQVLDVHSPVAILWNNTSPNAMRKRTWAPTNLFGTAAGQIYGGAIGIVYVAYIEGAREEAADLRVEAFRKRMEDFEHAGDIRIPISILTRLFPRPLDEGNPDLIESGVQSVSALYGDASLFDDFPTTIFTRAMQE